jgi:phosphatidylglycerol:prolipoprotein diacylglycerol transferase
VIPYYDFSAWTIRGVTFYTFGFLVAVGTLVGHYVTMRRARALGLRPLSTVDFFALTVFTGGYLFGHCLDAIFYHPETVRRDPWELLMVHHGLSSFGGILGAVLSGVVFIRIKKLHPWVFADLCTYAFPFGWLFGRLGCAVVHDHRGVRTDSILAVRFPDGPRYDLGLIEFALTPLLIALVVGVSRRTKRPGMISGALAIAYATMRFPLDFLRAYDLGSDGDPRYGGLTPAQWACFSMFALGVWLLHRARTNEPFPPEAPAAPIA